ncbi:MAG: hypothetical protein NZ914_14140, partial [Gemmatales bacterium]|nr:hypothetical protein [Gemmatales bacterium]
MILMDAEEYALGNRGTPGIAAEERTLAIGVEGTRGPERSHTRRLALPRTAGLNSPVASTAKFTS